MPTRFLLIRHAAIEAGDRLCGWFDLPLSPAGYQHVQALVGRINRSSAPEALLTSTLRRSLDVARPLGRAWGLEPTPADWAREIDCGRVEGMRFDEVRRVLPAMWRQNQAQNDDGFAWPGGETYAAFRLRILAGLAAAAAAHDGRRVAVVTHAGVVAQIIGVIRRRSAAEWASDRPRPLTGTEVIWSEGGPQAVLTHDDLDWYRGGPRPA